jgi:diguanylate cyclase (GGDEF)-like protein
MMSPRELLPQWVRACLAFTRMLSIKTRTFATLTVLLSCFAVLGVNSYLTMMTTSDRLGALRANTLPTQTVAIDISNDINTTHMKVFRFVTLASNGVSKPLLDALCSEVVSELDGETKRLRFLADPRQSFDSGKQELEFITTKWSMYAGGVKDLMDVGKADAPRAAMMMGATDENFQTIAAHLSAMSTQVNKRTVSIVSNILINVNANKLWLAFGGAAGMIISVFVAMGFARSLVKPIEAVTRAMRKVSSGAVDVDIKYRERKDEIGQMVEAVSTFCQTTRLHVETIAAQNRRFDGALNNMSHGLCMFDAAGTLIVQNNRYLEIYGMPPGSIEPGCTLREHLEILSVMGVVSGDHDRHIAELRAALAQGKSIQTARELCDGRIVHIFNRPMPGGGWVATHDDVTEQIRNEERVAYMARHDVLTGLPNRLHFRERAEEALPLLRRGEGFAVLCIDLDHFKEVNDTLGHPSGDKLLKLVADRLRKNLRETDILARLGGDEFAIVQTMLQRPEEVTVLASRIVEVLSEPYEVDGQEVVVGTSIGVAIAPGDGNDPDQLLKNADMALYRAKADGRGMFRFFEAEMDARLQARRRLEMELRKAVTQGEFEVYYQPIVDLTDNQVTAFEALVRWNHPERGLVMPDEFISIAEKIGLIGPIGEWVLRRACADAATWPRGIRVAVNLSPLQFRKALVSTVVQALASAGLCASRLELEITESVVLQNDEATMSMLRELHEIGVRISMDDFGTGYSSLSYLHSFPFDKIKIDRLFVSDLDANSDCAAIVRAVAGLGKTLGMKTTAEGVETREQLDWLRSEGCTEVQGYLFSRPQPARDLAILISDIDQLLAA